MFKFGFASECHDAQQSLDLKKEESSEISLDWVPANEVFLKNAISIDILQPNDVEKVKIGSEVLSCIKGTTVSSVINSTKFDVEENICLAERNHSDLIPSKYEGGLKLWECTHDVAGLLHQSEVSGKVVLDLGCGLGLLGILALKLGAKSVVFQDYNADVLRCVTIANVLLNADDSQQSRCSFFSGDWASFADLSPVCNLIVTSETIYNPANYTKLHETIKRLLKPDGMALIGAKSYYFGVGGSIKQFEKLVKEKNVFEVETVWKCSQGVQREILKLTFKNGKS
ncbi:histidine protein methyltransferase 1 homolog isoform X1 [Macrosteles quadrilineatus]|uniref:histidine protein methyltransferase 1 homolog isoform X1 n=1 Tax=Macrosteles quadrilineatus TaxID=74068 RepID=UPI0023E1DD68|nr:histidine protein methyltransferase 1 homolog isoform X1 [Macrosteles quadrilineatus]